MGWTLDNATVRVEGQATRGCDRIERGGLVVMVCLIGGPDRARGEGVR